MNWFAADHTRQVIFTDDNGFCRQLPFIDPADRLESVTTLAILLHQHEADLVHVGCEHDPHRSRFPGALDGQQVPHAVNTVLINKWFDLIDHNAADIIFFA